MHLAENGHIFKGENNAKSVKSRENVSALQNLLACSMHFSSDSVKFCRRIFRASLSINKTAPYHKNDSFRIHNCSTGLCYHLLGPPHLYDC